MADRATQSGRLCGICHLPGHNRRTCPQKQNTTTVPTEQAPPPNPIPPPNPPRRQIMIDISRLVYFVFDLETTGITSSTHNIIEIACTAISYDGEPFEDRFHELVRPPRSIPEFITQLTGIKNSDVSNARLFDEVGASFIDFITERLEESVSSTPIGVLVAHNGNRFDIPFLTRHLEVNNLQLPTSVKFKLDTLELARGVLRSDVATRYELLPPPNYKLATLYNYCTERLMSPDAHRADVDVDATVKILLYHYFWDNKYKYLHRLHLGTNVETIYGQPIRHTTSDAPTDHPSNQLEGSDEDSADESDDELPGTYVFGSKRNNRLEPIEYHQLVDQSESVQSNTTSQNTDSAGQVRGRPIPPGWHENTTFPGIDSAALFKAKVEASTRGHRNPLGIQGSVGSLNSPLKAWRSIFTKSIIDMIVRYTNDYGELNDKDWEEIKERDLLDFISVLFIGSVQRRKDSPTAWWSDDPITECIALKRIMTKRKFLKILRYLHVCKLEEAPGNSPYNPMVKIQELMDKLMLRFGKMFVPGQALSLDETLVRAFGRIKFKVRIITKSAV